MRGKRNMKIRIGSSRDKGRRKENIEKREEWEQRQGSWQDEWQERFGKRVEVVIKYIKKKGLWEWNNGWKTK